MAAAATIQISMATSVLTRDDGRDMRFLQLVAILSWKSSRAELWTRIVALRLADEARRRRVEWRRERDSNPRYPSGYSGFQDHRHRPLGHLSARFARQTHS